MKRFFLLVALLCMTGAPLRAENYKPTPENLQSRRQFSEDRFGIFIHWGIYSTFAQGEWYLQDGPLRREEYAKAVNAFYPHDFDAKAWAKVFKKAGARLHHVHNAPPRRLFDVEHAAERLQHHAYALRKGRRGTTGRGVSRE